ncbi:MAG: hypothetical protein HY074_11870 [Deltaproteobacteria bacterium]|nr:hypothetical protein [Deltaproteobacteria bacterium]
MRARWLLILIGAAAPFAGCNSDGIPLIGLDDDKNPVEVLVSKADYAKRMGTAVTAVQDSALPALNRRALGGDWLLRTLVVGIGVNAEIGIGPYKASALPKFRVVFSNSTDPTLP